VSRRGGPGYPYKGVGSSGKRPVVLRLLDESADDSALATRAGDGDRWSREALYRRHVDYLLGMVTRLLANRGEAEEIVQDTFVIGFQKIRTLRDPAALRSWLGQIAVSLVRRRMRRGRLLRLLGLDRGADDATLAALAAPGLDPEELAELALVDRQLGRMRTELRIAWVLRRVDELELTEVAAVIGCSLATAKRRITEADRQMRQHVGLPEGAP
jgi:RNA polymerase sigma-70 factor (ECF subfamily)